MSETLSNCYSIVINEDIKKETTNTEGLIFSNLDTLTDLLNSDFNDCLYYFIKHDKDITSEGTLKTPHIHLVLDFEGKISKPKVLERLTASFKVDPLSISIDNTISKEGSIQYLIHKKQKSKTQYSKDLIHTNDTENLERYILGQEAFMFEAIRTSQTKQELAERIGIATYNKFRGTINDLRGEALTYIELVKELNEVKAELAKVKAEKSKNANELINSISLTLYEPINDSEKISKISEIIRNSLKNK